MAELLYEDSLPGGSHWSLVMPAGSLLKDRKSVV